MKANEAPEKIYLTSDEKNSYVFTQKRSDGKGIEYIRTDAFIEKAWEWVENNMLSSNQQDKSRLYYQHFVNYMKGE